MYYKEDTLFIYYREVRYLNILMPLTIDIPNINTNIDTRTY